MPTMEKLPALSLRQPWTEEVMRGKKKIEYRSIPTNIRGRVYLYASLGRYSKTLEAEFSDDVGYDLDPLPRNRRDCRLHLQQEKRRLRMDVTQAQTISKTGKAEVQSSTRLVSAVWKVSLVDSRFPNAEDHRCQIPINIYLKIQFEISLIFTKN